MQATNSRNESDNSTSTPEYIDLGHSRLPILAERWITGWRDACNSAAVASAILASVAASVFIHIEERLTSASPALNPNSTKAIVLITFSYLAVVCNCAAVVLSFFISDRLISCPIVAELKPPVTRVRREELFNTLRTAFMWNLWTVSKYYWLATLSAGFLFLFGEFALYVWFFEKYRMIKAVILLFSVFGVTPLIIFWLEILVVLIRRCI
ncbi:hypothetical protein FRC15_001301 [Serendipita sp. 397]|nr:hypothetical protein FRC15_001301 [Serendipita sp. 397]